MIKKEKITLTSKAQQPLFGLFRALHLGYAAVIGIVTILNLIYPITASATFSREGMLAHQKEIYSAAVQKKTSTSSSIQFQDTSDLWNVLRKEFALEHYENHPAVQEKIAWYMNNQDFLIRSAKRAAPYLYYISQQIKERHLPAELALLPIIESGYNPLSLSTVGAAGIWQLMPATASDLGVRQDRWYDGRRDVIASTRAALNHLKYLENVYEGNWLLALAAYDTGEGNVHSAIVKNIRNGKSTNFWSLPLANETKNYIPSLLALAVIISHPKQYPIPFPSISNEPYLGQVDVGRQMNLKYAASLAGITHKKLLDLNPGFSHAAIPSHGPYKLVLPIENIKRFTENLIQSSIATRPKWTHYRTKSGDSLVSLAKKFDTTPQAIQKLNKLNTKTLKHSADILIPTRQSYAMQPGDTVYIVRANDTIKSIANHFHINPQSLRAANTDKAFVVGKQWIVPTHDTALKNTQTATSASSLSDKNHGLQPGDTIYMVRHGDTLDRIAQKFHVLPAEIRLANLIGNRPLNEGEHLMIPTHQVG